MGKTQITVFIALLSFLFGAAAAASVLDNTLSFANVSVSPNPVIAGGNVTIRFQLYNSFDYWLYDMNLYPSGGYPILNFSPQSGYHEGIVNPGLNATSINYTFSVPGTAPSGTYTIYFNATYQGLISTGEVVGASHIPVSFFVHNKPAIELVASNPQPPALYAGYNQTIDIGVENTGYGAARNVTVSVSAGPGASILSSVRSFFISNLTQGQAVEEPVLVSAKSASGVQLLADITYYSSNFDQRFRSSQSMNLSVAPAAQFSIASQQAGVAPGATDTPLRLTIANTGTSEASQVQLSLQSSYPITPVASTAYIADLPVGASENFTFLVSADSQGVPGNYPVTVYEQWKQPDGAVNQQFSGSNNYYVSVGGAGGGSGLIELAAAVVVIVAVVGYRLRARISSGKSKQKK